MAAKDRQLGSRGTIGSASAAVTSLIVSITAEGSFWRYLLILVSSLAIPFVGLIWSYCLESCKDFFKRLEIDQKANDATQSIMSLINDEATPSNHREQLQRNLADLNKELADFKVSNVRNLIKSGKGSRISRNNLDKVSQPDASSGPIALQSDLVANKRSEKNADNY